MTFLEASTQQGLACTINYVEYVLRLYSFNQRTRYHSQKSLKSVVSFIISLVVSP